MQSQTPQKTPPKYPYFARLPHRRRITRHTNATKKNKAIKEPNADGMPPRHRYHPPTPTRAAAAILHRAQAVRRCSFECLQIRSPCLSSVRSSARSCLSPAVCSQCFTLNAKNRSRSPQMSKKSSFLQIFRTATAAAQCLLNKGFQAVLPFFGRRQNDQKSTSM